MLIHCALQDWVRNFVKSKGISKAVASISIGGPRSPLLNEAAQKLVEYALRFLHLFVFLQFWEGTNCSSHR